MDESYLSAIFLWPLNWAPLGFMACQGQSLQVSQNQALYSLLGLTYGGSGTTSFNLPDFRGRVPVGYSPGPVGTFGTITSVRQLGPSVTSPSLAGVETITLSAAQVPLVSHTHTANVTTGATASVTATLYGIDNVGGEANPGGNFPGTDTGAGATSYALPGSGTPVAMAPNSVKVTNINLSGVTINPTGQSASQGVSIMQPFVVVNYIMATQGLYPSRN